MKIALISDIHGNYPALEAVFTQLDTMQIDHTICLGDIVGYYSFVNECCEALRTRNVHCLLGNHDWYLASGMGCPRSDSANRCIEYQRTVITPDNLAWLAALKPAALLYGINMVHGGWHDPLEEYVTPSASYFSHMEGQLFASGHTHVPCVLNLHNKIYCNPGSVGQPRDGNPKASFAVFDDQNTFQLHRVDYDICATQAAMAKAGFDAYFYNNLTSGTRIGGKIDRLPI